jgi:hypothetical protein
MSMAAWMVVDFLPQANAYWSFGSRLNTILKYSSFQKLGMVKGTTEAVNQSFSSALDPV